MTISKVICALALIVQIQVHITNGTNSSPSRGASRSQGLNALFGKNFQSDLQSLSLAFTPGNKPQHFANDKSVTGSGENNLDEITKPSINLFQTDKGGNLVGGEDETFYTESSQKRNDITKTTLYNILSQTEESEKKVDDRKMQKRESVQEDEETKSVTASGSAEIPAETDVEASGQTKDQSTDSLVTLKGTRNDHVSQTKGEPEFSGKNLEAPAEQGSGDFQDSGSGMEMSKKLQGQVTVVSGDSSKMVPSHREPKRGSPLVKNVRLGAHYKPTKAIVKGEGSGESGGEKMSFDPVLLFQVRNIRTNVLKAEKQATKELNDVRKEFWAKMEDLEEDLRMVRKLTSNVHKKVGITVKQALTMARQAKTNATNRLFMARRAATALNNIEKKLGVIHTVNASRILRSRIPQFPKLNDVALYKQVLDTNAILTKLDGAKELAVYRAEKRFHNEEETGSSIENEVDSLRDELASAEHELSDETEKELKDEREAQEKIQEAMKRNQLVAKKTAFALTAIENYLEKLQSDESKLKRLRF